MGNEIKQTVAGQIGTNEALIAELGVHHETAMKLQGALNFCDIDLSSLTDEQLYAVKVLATAALEHFNKVALAAEEDSWKAFNLLGDIRRENKARSDAA